MESLLTKKTGTVLRQLKATAAMFNLVSLEMDITLDRQHSFTNFKIPNLGKDTKDRKEFSADQIQIIRDMPFSKTPEITHLIQLMLDTGMRISECCGLMVKDIKLEAETPYLEIYRNNVRELKTKNSRRLIPLVGSSLTAMQEAVERASGDFVFPRYVDESSGSIKNNNASAACKKRLIALLGEDTPTSYGFRHTLQTRLRNVECPKELRNELGGWAKDISDRYGSPSDLRLKARYLNATVTK
jgi:integrase